ncbi:MAG: GGDEF domain-containing protein [Clostridiales bacterium]|nr:GGDEF domain-containing protein [Clostridiales bacterium]
MELVNASARNTRRLVKATITVLVTVVVFFFASKALMDYFGVKCHGKYKIDRCYVVSHYTNGITRYSSNSRFETLNKGDSATISFTIPQGIYAIFPDPVLRFDYYNCAVKVYDESGKLIFANGWKDPAYTIPENFTGNCTCSIPLFTNSYNLSGQRIKVCMESIANNSVSRFEGYIVRSLDSWKVPIDGKQVMFVLLTAIVVISGLLALYSIVKSIANRELDMGISIFLTVFCFTMWSLGSQRMIGVLIQDVDICAKIEYYSLYALSVSIALFGLSFFRQGLFRKIWGIILAVASCFFVAVCCVRICSKSISIQDFMIPLTLFIFAEVTFFAVGANVDKYKNKAVSTVIIRCGVLIMAILVLLEIGRYLMVFVLGDTAISDFASGSYAAVILTAIMMTYYIILILEAQTTIVERQKLEEIAYTDTLTGIPNRTYFNRRLDDMSSEEQKEYTMIFMDLNNLKKTNDEFGHEMGDKLIKAAAGCMTKAFEGKGIYCRWGGDEFVAFVPGSEETGAGCIDVLRNSLDEINSTKEFIFDISAAIGEVRSDENAPVDPNSAIREADVRMYEIKKQMKAEMT